MSAARDTAYASSGPRAVVSLVFAWHAEQFLREIETTANFRHPHILPLYDSGEADGFLFCVMPYVDGESLRERLTRESSSPSPTP